MHRAKGRFDFGVRTVPRGLAKRFQRGIELPQLFSKLGNFVFRRASRDTNPNDRLAALHQLRGVRTEARKILLRQSFMLQRMKHVMKIRVLLDAELFAASIRTAGENASNVSDEHNRATAVEKETAPNNFNDSFSAFEVIRADYTETAGDENRDKR